MKKSAAVLLIISALVIVSMHVPIYFYPLNKVLLYLVEKRLDIDIDCRSLKIYLWRSFAAEGVKVLGKGGFALSAESATLDYNLASLITGRLHLVCNLENVKFYKTNAIMNSISDILYIQPLGDVTFQNMRADFYIGRDDMLTQDLALLSEKIKIFANAVTGRDDTIRSLVYFSLLSDIVKDIPEDVRNALFEKEEGPWSSVCIGIMGNYKKPHLKIMTGRLRMNISSK